MSTVGQVRKNGSIPKAPLTAFWTSKTEGFFESLGVNTRLSDYGVKMDTIDKIVARFEERKWVALGDRGLTTPEVTRKALELQL